MTASRINPETSGQNEVPPRIPASAQVPIEKLAYSGKELEAILGVSTVTLWRLEKRGLLKPVSGIRHKIYSRKSVESFLEGRAA